MLLRLPQQRQSSFIRIFNLLTHKQNQNLIKLNNWYTSYPIKILQEEKGQPCIVFLKNVYFFQRKTAIANWKPTYSSTPILFSLNLEVTYWFTILNKPPLFPFKCLPSTRAESFQGDCSSVYLQVLALLLLPKNAKHNSIVHLKGSNRQK